MRISIFQYVYFLLTTLIVTSVDAHGLIDDRLHKLEHAIIYAPKEPVLYVKRGRVYQDSEQWDQALINYAKALKIDPTYYEAMYWQGYTLLQKGDYIIAEKTLQEYLTQETDSPAGHRIMAKVYFQLGNFLKAADAYDQSINNDLKSPPQVYLERVQTLLKVNPIPTERISSGLIEGISKHGEIVTFLELLIDLNINRGNYQAAVVWMKKLPVKLQKTPHWLIKKAELVALQGQHEIAISLYNMTIDDIAALPNYKQNLPAFIAARQKAKKAILLLK